MTWPEHPRILEINTCTWLKLFVIVSVFMLSAPLAAAPTPAVDVRVVEELLQDTVESYRIPGLAAAIVSDRDVVFASGYGEASPGIDVTRDTPFLLGSTTKAFTALAVMRLVEQGKVGLDSPVKRYLSEFRLGIPGAEDGISVRHLLNHTSGLCGKCMLGSTLGEESLEEELLSLTGCIPDSSPGERFAYFNGNYRLLGLIIERVGGVRYGDFLNTEIFKPLSMNNTHAGPEGVKGLAVGHGQLFGFPFQRKQAYRPGALPSGYLVSTVSDLGRFLIAEIQAGSGNSGPLDPETVRATWRPPGNAKAGYAMGWMVVDDPLSGPFLAHGGALENYRSFLYIDPNHNVGFAILMNQGGFLPSVLGFAAARDGLLQIVQGGRPESRPRQWPIVVVSAVFVLVVGMGVFSTMRLRNWPSPAGRQKPWKRWVGAFIELVGSCFLLFGFIPFTNILMGDRADWALVYGFVPELYFLLVLLICLGFFRVFLKVWVLSRARRSVGSWNSGSRPGMVSHS